MEQNSSWEANGVSDSQEISGISWTPKFHDFFHKKPKTYLTYKFYHFEGFWSNRGNFSNAAD
jgi:hypothetical protein